MDALNRCSWREKKSLDRFRLILTCCRLWEIGKRLVSNTCLNRIGVELGDPAEQRTERGRNRLPLIDHTLIVDAEATDLPGTHCSSSLTRFLVVLQLSPRGGSLPSPGRSSGCGFLVGSLTWTI